VRVVVQRVAQAAVEVAGKEVARIGKGLLVLVGFRPGDSEADLQWMARKLLGLRIFEDAAGKMNVSVQEIGGEILLVPQFTLYADCRKGRRPGFSEALAPDQAERTFSAILRNMYREGRARASRHFWRSYVCFTD